MMSKLTTLIACAAIALTPLSPLMAETASSPGDPVAESWAPATQAELDEARGGYFWVVGAGGTAIRLCLSNSRACQATGVFVAKNLVSAKSWACKKYGRFC
jgi:hypothetical protein